MLTLGPLGFAAPLALIGLVALPMIWWLLRATPPAPKRVTFPPLKLLMGLQPKEETPDHTPWWVVVLRLILAALVIIALARPILFPLGRDEATGPLILIIEDGWSAAPTWRSTEQTAVRALNAAARADRTAAVVFTAPRDGADEAVILQDPADLARSLQAHSPAPWPSDLSATAGRLSAAGNNGDLGQAPSFIWLTDGVANDDVEPFARTLAELGDVRVQAPPPSRLPIIMRPPQTEPRGLSVELLRTSSGRPQSGAVLALDSGGRALARAPFNFGSGETTTRALAETPLEVRNRIASLRLERNASAGGAQALDDAWRQPLVGLISATADDERQPLLSELHYVEQALAGRAVTVRGSLDALLARNPSALVLTDTAQPTPAAMNALRNYVDEGGLLIRFAGPRLADDPDDLIPVTLRAGGRLLGGALAWDEPQPLAPFPENSPFFDLSAPDEATVSQQVLAQPEPDLNNKVWARLDDGTPLVTSAARGEGRLIFFHITANPAWSDVPLSGVFASMMVRTLTYAGNANRSETEDVGGDGAWTLQTSLDADGRMIPADGGASIEAANIAEASFGPSAPPGVYSRGASRLARNITGPEDEISAITQLPAGLTLEPLGELAPLRLMGPLLAAALVLLAIDAIAMAHLAGRLRLPTARRASTAAVIGAALVFSVGLNAGFGNRASAQSTPDAIDTADEAAAIEALRVLRLAYVVTGDRRVDQMSEAGLRGLSRQLERRTSVNPGDPLSVDIENDELGIWPLLYWPVSADTPQPSPEAADKLDRFIKTGGVLVIDTQDGGAGFSNEPNAGLQTIGAVLDIPPLKRVPADPQGHVLNRSFYLLTDLPGRWTDTAVWVEADERGSARDGVSGVVIGSADWAAAWAVDDTGAPLAVLAGGNQRQREMAYRAGINLVMYVLTGNYKSDQVHVPKILERLGQ